MTSDPWQLHRVSLTDGSKDLSIYEWTPPEHEWEMGVESELPGSLSSNGRFVLVPHLARGQGGCGFQWILDTSYQFANPELIALRSDESMPQVDLRPTCRGRIRLPRLAPDQIVWIQKFSGDDVDLVTVEIETGEHHRYDLGPEGSVLLLDVAENGTFALWTRSSVRAGTLGSSGVSLSEPIQIQEEDWLRHWTHAVVFSIPIDLPDGASLAP
jgi:hypothetical protein